jgi:hypothetical protein
MQHFFVCRKYHVVFINLWTLHLHFAFLLSDLPIFSIDIHPDGSRFATGGQGENIVFALKIYYILNLNT